MKLYQVERLAYRSHTLYQGSDGAIALNTINDAQRLAERDAGAQFAETRVEAHVYEGGQTVELRSVRRRDRRYAATVLRLSTWETSTGGPLDQFRPIS